MSRLKIISEDLTKEDWQRVLSAGLTEGQRKLIGLLQKNGNQPISHEECKKLSGVASFKTLINGWLSRMYRPYRLQEVPEPDGKLKYKMRVVQQRPQKGVMCSIF